MRARTALVATGAASGLASTGTTISTDFAVLGDTENLPQCGRSDGSRGQHEPEVSSDPTSIMANPRPDRNVTAPASRAHGPLPVTPNVCPGPNGPGQLEAAGNIRSVRTPVCDAADWSPLLRPHPVFSIASSIFRTTRWHFPTLGGTIPSLFVLDSDHHGFVSADIAGI